MRGAHYAVGMDATVLAAIARWPNVPAVFGWLQQLGNVDREEMFRVFNMGIGFVLVVRDRSVGEVQEPLAARHVDAKLIGRVVPGERGVVCLN